MPLQHEQIPNCGIYHFYIIFDVTNGTDGKFHWALKFWLWKLMILLNSMFYWTEIHMKAN